jgi:hypothetical protein
VEGAGAASRYVGPPWTTRGLRGPQNPEGGREEAAPRSGGETGGGFRELAAGRRPLPESAALAAPTHVPATLAHLVTLVARLGAATLLPPGGESLRSDVRGGRPLPQWRLATRAGVGTKAGRMPGGGLRVWENPRFFLGDSSRPRAKTSQAGSARTAPASPRRAENAARRGRGRGRGGARPGGGGAGAELKVQCPNRFWAVLFPAASSRAREQCLVLETLDKNVLTE